MRRGLKSATVRVLTPLTDCKQGASQGLIVKPLHEVLTKEIKQNRTEAQKETHTYMDTDFPPKVMEKQWFIQQMVL